MKTRFLNIFILSLAIALASCDEPFKLDPKQTVEKVVIEGLVTDQPNRQSVKLSKTNSFYSTGPSPRISNAVVTVSDDLGKTVNFIHNPRNHRDSVGIYIPEEAFTGEIGRTYKLRVDIEGEIFEAEDMLAQVSKIDSLSYEIDEDEVDDPEVEGKIYEVLMYIKEPKDEVNFYLIKFYRNGVLTLYDNNDIYISDDEILAENIDGVAGPTIYGIGDEAKVELYSLSRRGYVFYSDLSNILNGDGGMFGPVPSSPRTNLSNGALGFFQVSAIQSNTIKVE
ncbi:DUF4249 domain-containing protein [Chryseosolibacter indicus]|uniref:DUF4249 family protein n=1 Tax=Chryseosolibacter indicus TaxID=2782351 RepID=A0ABS5VUH2_9BACT|nr:DUF4249 domain-containing protein [Chryseosolibacter indicus]MBT1704846.1 DUF4249 family protein [Chryseosolibacter indicus]